MVSPLVADCVFYILEYARERKKVVNFLKFRIFSIIRAEDI